MAQENTLCWWCDNACGNCDWSMYEKPIKKWIAKKDYIDNGKYGGIASYIIRWCPQYKGVVKGVLVPNKFIEELTGKINLSAYSIKRINEVSPIPIRKINVGSDHLFSIGKRDYKKWKSKSSLTENDIEL